MFAIYDIKLITIKGVFIMSKGLLNKITKNKEVVETANEVNVTSETTKVNQDNLAFLKQEININFEKFKIENNYKAVYEVDNDKSTPLFTENEYGLITPFIDNEPIDAYNHYQIKDPV